MKKEMKAIPKTFITFTGKSRLKTLDFNNNKIYVGGNVSIANNKTKGHLVVANANISHINGKYTIGKIRLLFKMLKAKNFIFAEIK